MCWWKKCRVNRAELKDSAEVERTHTRLGAIDHCTGRLRGRREQRAGIQDVRPPPPLRPSCTQTERSPGTASELLPLNRDSVGYCGMLSLAVYFYTNKDTLTFNNTNKILCLQYIKENLNN